MRQYAAGVEAPKSAADASASPALKGLIARRPAPSGLVCRCYPRPDDRVERSASERASSMGSPLSETITSPALMPAL